MNLLHVLVLAIIEGLTEFLPVSSTGHMIIGSTAMGIASEPFVKVFTVAIQPGAILAVVALYWRRFFQSFMVYVQLFVAFIPAAVVGLLAKKYIDRLLENIVVVGAALVVGGIVLLFVDDYFEKRSRKNTDFDDITLSRAFAIGAFQVLSMIPGVSRSAATIIGGLTQGLSPRTAAEFSFLLAVPTMFAATAKSMWDYVKDEGGLITEQETTLLLIGNVVAFLVALVAIRGFVNYLTKHGFKIFGYYRIIVGLIIMVLWALGYFEGVDTSLF